MDNYRLRAFLLLCFAALAMSGCTRTDASGEYMAKFTNGVYRLQLVETSDGHLTGQLDTVVINPQDKIDYNSFAANGVKNGRSVSLSFKQASLLPTSLSGSGTLDYNSLSLTGDINPGKLSTVVFVRASDAQYQSVVNGLISEVNNVAAAKAAAENQKNLLARQHAFATAIEQLVSGMQRFDADAETHLARWPETAQTYREITAQMTAYLNHERDLVGDTEASVRRGQISAAINQTSIAADQLHNNVQSLQTNFEANVVPLMSTLELAMTRCNAAGVTTISDEIKDACADIARANQPFRQSYTAFNNGLAQLESVYQEEREKQAQLVQASERME
ncbi:MAG: hypothetical protein ABSD21_05345 [Rhizomicrobium sp.]|jgi:hypothetical protein